MGGEFWSTTCFIIGLAPENGAEFTWLYHWWAIPAILGAIYLALMFFGLLGFLQLLSPVKENLHVSMDQLVKYLSPENDRWITENGLTLRGEYTVGMIKLNLFVLPDDQTQMALFVCGNVHGFGFQTKLTNDCSLETLNLKESEGLPALPKAYRQTMLVSTLEELHQYHQEGLRVLTNTKSLHPIPLVAPEGQKEELQRDAREELRKVFSKPMMILLIPYYYFTKQQRCNLTIAKQFEKNPWK